jgi:hypothetical protein
MVLAAILCRYARIATIVMMAWIFQRWHMSRRTDAPRPAAEKFLPQYIQITKRLRKLDLSADEIAFVLGITTRTYWDWRAKHPEFKKAAKTSRRGPRLKAKRRNFST